MDNILCKEAGERIQVIRKARGYTRDKLAEKAKVSSKFLYEVERGKKKFSAEVLCHIAEALGVSCDYIMFGEVKRASQEKGLAEVVSLFDRGQQQKLIPLLKLIYEFIN